MGFCQYDGSKYSGFQAQKNAISIQNPYDGLDYKKLPQSP